MSSQIKRIKIGKDVSLNQILEQADRGPVEIERDGKIYDIYARPFTAESVYGSVKTVDGRTGAQVSNEEIEAAIRRANEENAERVMHSLRDDA